MLSTNVRPSSLVVPLANLAQASISGATHFSAFVDTAQYHRFLLVVTTGAQGGADVEMRQSAASNGGTPKALNFDGGVEKYTLAAGDDDVVKAYDVGPVDCEGGYRYIDVTITPTGSGVYGAQLFGVGPKNEVGASPSTT